MQIDQCCSSKLISSLIFGLLLRLRRRRRAVRLRRRSQQQLQSRPSEIPQLSHPTKRGTIHADDTNRGANNRNKGQYK